MRKRKKAAQEPIPLIIRHQANTDPPRFQVERSDGKGAPAVSLPSPFKFAKGLASSNLISELQWYLEDFLEYPFHPNTDKAERVLDSLKTWGTETFQALFSSGHARDWFFEATKNGYQKLHLQIISDDPAILQWPWEALRDPDAESLGLLCRMERRLNNVRDPMPIPKDLPEDRINILLITARPYENDAHYRSISRPLVELIEKRNIPAHVHVLRPPTFENLREHLKARPGYYHLIHFDGHGGFGSAAPAGDRRHSYQGEGVLVFETEKGEPENVSAEKLSALLRQYAVPAIVLNACRSAMLDESAQDPFASVAAALIKAGVRSVVAMAYSLYVSGAQVFLPAFYGELFESGNMAAAALAGRQKMFEDNKRVCARGRFELNDFLVPVMYRQEPFDFSFKKTSGKGGIIEKPALSEEAADTENPYGFIGRDRELLKLERAIRKEAPAILIHGLGGVGKTTLARGFLKWLSETEGMDCCIWLSFMDVRSAEFVLNYMGSRLFGSDFLAADIPQKVEALAHALRENRIYVVWDNFEVVEGISGAHGEPNLSDDDRNILLSLLKKMWGGKGKIIITSRSEEKWLDVQRMKQSIGGMVGEERWEYCEKILTNLGISPERDDPDMVELMDLLGGHPLAMRVILPHLESIGTRELIKIIRSNMDKLGPEAEKLYATLRFVEDKLDEKLKPLLGLLSLHEGYIDADLMEHMAKQVDGNWTREKVGLFCDSLASAGLLRDIGASVFELHPALSGYLRSTASTEGYSKDHDQWARAFVGVMGSLANELAPKPLHEQRMYFHLFGANFRFALSEAGRLKMAVDERALTQSLAAYAQNIGNFSEAWTLFEKLGELQKKAGDKEGEAAAYHQLGMIAEKRRDFETAEKWYLKSLAISEKLGIEQFAASTYHQLGRIAQERRDFETAEKWYLKSLAISEKQGNEHGAASTYHQLGMIAQERRDFDTAEKWYLKSLAVSEKLNVEYGMAITYHQLGMIAQERRDFDTAEKWYLKSLAISEKLGIEHYAASTYHQLGIIAQERRDFETAEKWYLKSLAIDEKQGNEHGAASTYHQLGRTAEERRDLETAEKWFLKSLAISEKLNIEYGMALNYHQLGMIAQERRDFQTAEKWYLKSLAIEEKHKNTYGALISYRTLEELAKEKGDAAAAEKWRRKVASLEKERGRGSNI